MPDVPSRSRFALAILIVVFAWLSHSSADVSAQLVKNADGTSTTTVKDSTYSQGGTKETTNNAQGKRSKEEWKDAKGKTVHITYTIYPPDGSVREDDAHFNEDGTPQWTETFVMYPDGTEVIDHFTFEKSVQVSGDRQVTPPMGEPEYFYLDPTTGKWDSIPYTPAPFFRLREVNPSMSDIPRKGMNVPPEMRELIAQYTGWTSGLSCCDPSGQGLALHARTALGVAPSPLYVPPPARSPLASPVVERWSWRPPQAQPSNRPGDLIAVVTSLGTSQGEAFQLQILNHSTRPVWLALEGVVVEPIKRSELDNARKALAQMAPQLKNAAAVKVEGYCLNYALQPPETGTIFRVAAPDVQSKYAATRRLLPAASFLERAGQLTPDSNPKIYVESIKQYSLWALLENWDERAFTQAWVDTTRKQFAAAKRAWTADLDKALRSAAPRRWTDIQRILSLVK